MQRRVGARTVSGEATTGAPRVQSARGCVSRRERPPRRAERRGGVRVGAGYLGFLPASRHEEAPIVNPGLEPEITDNDLALNEFMPDADNAAYDMHDLLLNIFDDGDFHELAAQTAPNVITGFSRVDGRSVGVVANQPQFLSGHWIRSAQTKRPASCGSAMPTRFPSCSSSTHRPHASRS
ncbi:MULTISPECIES: carboxyl transferase domain-containing protein [Rhodococcus]|uniref:carboxyl transferase domain-containing protein n=1 Tax=Rhodococcus TaxID=1827 RepID=UPI001ED8FAC7|nr:MULTISPECIES: carboxyl transferase domain-containing protein [Rhodococcus]